MRPEAALFCAVLFVLFVSTNASEQRVVCYYTNWSVYRPGNAKFSPQNINPYLCTHLIYAFGGLTRENGLRPYDKYQDIEQGGYAKFTGLKTYNKALKTLLAIGGWNEGSTRFSPLVADPERREEFVKNVVRFLRQNHFDGLDLDWEYPAFRDGGKPKDRDNYAQLVQELREEFNRESSKTGRTRLLLTMAVPAGIEYIDKGYDIPKLNRNLDFMNILSYDYHSAFEPAVNHHSPLYPLEEVDAEYNFDAQLTIDYTIEHYLKLGADRDKLVLGIPTYGRSYTLFNPLATEVGAPADGPGEQGDATREKGYLAYYEICESLESNEWKVEKPNPKAMGPYAFKGNQWVGYDDEDIVRKKAKYVNEKRLGGIMFWAIDNDDFRGKCHGRPYPLIEAGKEALLGIESRSTNDISPPKERSRSTVKPTTTPIITTTVSSRKRRPKPKTSRPRVSADSSTVTTPVYVYPATTPEPPTTPDPGSDFKCKDEGFFPHPRDCKKYFWCLDSGPSNLGIVAHQFTCPSGLFFNKAADSCDYTRNVICNKKKSGEGSSTTPRPKVTAATSKTTRLSSASSTTTAPSTTTRTTTTTTTTTIAPVVEEEEEEDYDEVDQEDPKTIKELIKLLQEIGGLEGLQRQLALKEQNSPNGDSVAPTPGFSRSLYNRVLNRGNSKSAVFKSRQNVQATSTSTTPSYRSSVRNRGGPQNQGLESLDEVANLKKEKPQYVTIRRERPTTPEIKVKDEIEDENSEELVELDEEEKENESTQRPSNRNPEYLVLNRRSKSTTSSPKEITKEITSPRYVTILRGTSNKHEEDSGKQSLDNNRDSKLKAENLDKENESLESNSKSIQITPSYTQINRSKAPKTIEDLEEDKDVQTESVTLAAVKVSPFNRTYVEINRNRELNLITPVESTTQQTFQTSYEELIKDEISTKSLEIILNKKDSTTYSYIDTEAETTNLNNQETRISSTSSPDSNPDLSISTTTQEPPTTLSFTPTVTRVITSVTESGTERQRISVNRIKGHYILDLGPKLFSIVTTPIPDSQASSEKIMEINRITHVTKDINSHSTSDLSITEVVTESLDRIKEVNRVSHVTLSQEDSTTPLNLDEEFDNKNEFFVTENPIITSTSGKRLKNINNQRIFQRERTRKPTGEILIKENINELNNDNKQNTLRKPFNQTNFEEKVNQRRKFNRFRSTTSLPPLEDSLSTPKKYQRLRTTSSSPFENNNNENNRKKYRFRSTSPRTNKLEEENIDLNSDDNVNEDLKFINPTRKNYRFRSTTSKSDEDIVENENIDNTNEENLKDRSTRRTNRFRTTTSKPTSISEIDEDENIEENTEDLKEIKDTITTRKINRFRTTSPKTFEIKNEETDDIDITNDEDLKDIITTKRTFRFKTTTSKSTSISENENNDDDNDDDVIEVKETSTTKKINRFRTTSPKTNEVKNEETVVIDNTNEEDLKDTSTTKRTFRFRTTTSKSTSIGKDEKYDEDVEDFKNNSNKNDTNTGFRKIYKFKTTSPKTFEDNFEEEVVKEINKHNGTTTRKSFRFRSTTPRPSSSIDYNLENENTTISEGNENAEDIKNTSRKLIRLRTSTTRPSENFEDQNKTINLNNSKYQSKNSKLNNDTIYKNDNKESPEISSEISSSQNKNSYSHDSIEKSKTENSISQQINNQTNLNRIEDTTDILLEEILTTIPTLEISSLDSDNNNDISTNTTKKTELDPITIENYINSNESNIVVNKKDENRHEIINATTRSPETRSTSQRGTIRFRGNSTYLNRNNGTNSERKIIRRIKINSKNDRLNNNNNYEFNNFTKEINNSSTLDKRTNSQFRNISSRRVNVRRRPVNTNDDSKNEEKEEVLSESNSDLIIPVTKSPTNRTRIVKRRRRPITTSPQPLRESSYNLRGWSATGPTPSPLPDEDVKINSIRDERESIRTYDYEAQDINSLTEDFTSDYADSLYSEVEPSKTTTTRRPVSPAFTKRLRKRPVSTTNRSTTTTLEPTTLESEELSSTSSTSTTRKPSTGRIIRRRKFQRGNSTEENHVTRGRNSIQKSTRSHNDKEHQVSSTEPTITTKKYAFPRRTTTTTTTTTTTSAPITPEDILIEEDDSHRDSLEAPAHIDSHTIDASTVKNLPDLARPAVAAITNLVTVSPIPIVSSSGSPAPLRTSTPTAFSVYSTSPRFTTGPVLFSSTALPPSSVSTASRARQRGKPFAKVVTSPSPPPQVVVTRIRAPIPPPIADYEYYDDLSGFLEQSIPSNKVKIHSDGYIECLDQGNFPHPFSCKKFISCAKMENGEVLGWEYTCPKHLSFDPIGGICNWSAGLGCKE